MNLNFKRDGVEIREGVLASSDIGFIASDISLDSEILRRGGFRNLEKKFTSIAKLAAERSVLQLAQSCLKGTPRLVRALFFDKTPDNNWFVSWHQDKTVTLNRRAALKGWGPWSLKDGVCHVQPPCSVLNKMVAIRLHVDAADASSGCLKVIPRTHRLGIIKQAEIDGIVEREIAVDCAVKAGDAVIMRPHVLHSSSKSMAKSHRRVVHLEYGDFKLPGSLCWA
jgi:ectoine hydroxylase-related dioxygenase (phytanoyl-CoA dioxygenase family)